MSARISAKALAIGATIVMVATIVAGLIAIGPPDAQRKHRLDERRIADLSAIVRAMPGYWNKTKALPPNLATLAKEPGLHLHIFDPETRVAYEYATTGERSFRLCAVFAEESTDDARRVYYPGGSDWPHGAGHDCFERKMSAEAGSGRPSFE